MASDIVVSWTVQHSYFNLFCDQVIKDIIQVSAIIQDCVFLILPS